MSDFEFIPPGLTLADAIITLRPLVLYLLGMVVYAVFIFKFYRFVGSKNIFEYDLAKYEQARFRSIRVFLHSLFYVGKYLIVFPFVAFFWFAVLTVLLTFLARDQSMQTTLLISIAVVSAIRVTAYYNEDLSRDLAKILPFALLGVFVINLSYFRLSDSLEVLQQVAAELENILYYLMFVIALEFLLRIGAPVVKFTWESMTSPRPRARRRRDTSTVPESQQPEEQPAKAEEEPSPVTPVA